MDHSLFYNIVLLPYTIVTFQFAYLFLFWRAFCGTIWSKFVDFPTKDRFNLKKHIYSTVQKECKQISRISELSATLRDFATKYNEISGETNFHSNFVEMSKFVSIKTKVRNNHANIPAKFRCDVAKFCRDSEISRVLIKSSERAFALTFEKGQAKPS